MSDLEVDELRETCRLERCNEKQHRGAPEVDAVRRMLASDWIGHDREGEVTMPSRHKNRAMGARIYSNRELARPIWTRLIIKHTLRACAAVACSGVAANLERWARVCVCASHDSQLVTPVAGS